MKSSVLIASSAVILLSAAYFTFESAFIPRDTEDPAPPRRASLLTETDWNDYIWPTTASTWKTSSFCEFRKTHFHAGIDISTNMKRGYPVLASRDGWIHSIEFEPYGYGWYLVVRHFDGFYTAYAHLDGFPPALEEAYFDRLIAAGRSFGLAEWQAGDLPVGKGDTIAFTGSTGAGPPHLHFEIRDRDFNPVHPELAPRLRVPDVQRPIFMGLAITPLDAASSVDGKHKTVLYSVKRTSDSTFALKGTPKILGRVGFEVKALDGADGFKDMETPYELRLAVKERTLFGSRFDRILDSHSWHIRIDRNNDLMQARKGEYRKLYAEDGNILDVYEPVDAHRGVISASSVGAGAHTFRIDAVDISGNGSSLQMKSLVHEHTPFRIERRKNALALHLPEQHNATVAEIYGQRGGRWRTILSRKIASDEMSVEIPQNYRGMNAFRADLKSREGLVIGTRYAGAAAAAKDPQISINHATSRGDIVFEISVGRGIIGEAEVALKANGEKRQGRILPTSGSRIRAIVGGWHGCSGDMEAHIRLKVSGQWIERRYRLSEQFVDARLGGSVYSDDGRFVATFEPYDLTASTFIDIRKSNGAHSVYPMDIPLAGKPSILMKADSHPADGKNYIGMSGAGSIAGTTPRTKDDDSPAVAAIVRKYFGSYTVLRDTTAPVISVISRKSTLAFAVEDAGVGYSREAVVLTNSTGEVIPVVFDERRGRYEVPDEFGSQLAKGATISVRDRLGNTANQPFK